MNMPSPEEQRTLILQWEETGRFLDELRRKELRGKPYNWQEVDTLLQLADNYDGPIDSSGIIEMQRLFMQHPFYKDPKNKITG
ncbi:MAG: hypothetical protein AMXMBFR84_36650 [Candidatus Hydrogenedentota bacterium]